MAYTRNIKVEDLGKYEKKLAKNAPKMIDKLFRQVAKEGVQTLKQITRDVDAVAAGKMLRGWRVVKGKSTGKSVMFSIENEKDYTRFVETGRRRGAKRPPPKAIEQWVRIKLGVSGAEAKSAAFAIATAISRRGIKPRRISFRAMQPIIHNYRKKLLAANEKFLQKGLL